MSRVRLSLKPGQPGTKGLLAEYGERLVCVRYRYDAQKRRRFKTVELIVESTDWRPRGGQAEGEQMVSLRVDWRELDLRQRVKAAGGVWDRENRVWRLSLGGVTDLGLESRIVDRDP